MKKISAAVIIGVLLLFAGCSKNAIQEESNIVIDQMDREVVLPMDVERVVSSYYTATSTILALDAQDKLVGIEMGAGKRGLFQAIDTDMQALPAVGSGKGINIEEIASLDPDVVILPTRLAENIDTLEQMGMAVVMVSPESNEELLEMFALLGTVLDKEEESKKLIDFYNNKLKEIEKLELKAEKNVYLSSNSSPLSTATGNMYQNYMIETAGGINVTSTLQDTYWTNISPEQLLAYNPDIWLVVQGASYSIEEILADPRFTDINAVKNGKVYMIPSTLEGWDYPTPSAILGVLFTTNLLHADQYTNEMLMRDVAMFYEEFYDIDINQGIK